MLALMAAGAVPVGAQPAPVEPTPAIRAPMQPRALVEELTAQLRAAVGDRDSRRRDRTLNGLRTVRDPAMLAFFSQLAINPSPMLRVHGLLGLAELEPQRGLNLLGVSRIPDERLQGVIISSAIAAGLLSDENRSELTGWASLPTRLRIELAAACAARSRPFDVAAVRSFLNDQEPFVAVSAAVVLRRAGVETVAAEQTIRTRALGLAQGAGVQAAELSELVIEHNLTSAGEALTIAARGLQPGAPADAVAAARLLVSPGDAAVVSAARARLDIAAPLAERTAFAVRLLDVVQSLGGRTPAPVLREMATDPDPLIKAIAAAAEAISRDDNAGAAVGALARRGDPATVAWALRFASERHWQDARTIRAAVIDGVARRPAGAAVDPRLSEMAVAAAAALCDDDPRSLDRPLAEALSAGDGSLTRIVLEGALRSRHQETGALVRQGAFEVRPAGPWPTGDAAALALLVSVRHGEFTADRPERIARLSAIARAERGTLSGVVRAQAAWLALRESGEDRVALTRILSDLPLPSTDTPLPPPSVTVPLQPTPAPTK